jgi:hypothetical protein
MTLAVRLSQVSIQEPDGWQLVALDRAPRQTPRNGVKGHTLKLQIADYDRPKSQNRVVRLSADHPFRRL